MSSFNVLESMLISLATIVILTVVLRNEKSSLRRSFFILLSISVYFFSGIGIAYEDVDNYYIVYYLVFLFLILFTIKVVFGLPIDKTIIKYKFNNFKINDPKYDLDYNNKLYVILTIVFYLSLFIYLVYPEFKIIDFFSPSSPVSFDIYERRAISTNNLILNVSDTIRVFTFPFFCVYLYKLITRGKKHKYFY